MLPAVDTDVGHHRRYSCDELLATTNPMGDSDDSDIEPADPEGLLGHDPSLQGGDHDHVVSASGISATPGRPRAFFVRTLALLCVCSLSVGSH